MVQLVRVCRSCRHVNRVENSDRCSNCWYLLTGIEPVSVERGERLAKRRRIHVRRPLFAFFLCLSIGLIAWWLSLRFALDSVLFPPPPATSTISPAITAQSWPQGRRTAANTGFTPEEAPRPTHVKWSFSTAKSLFAGPAVTEDLLYYLQRTAAPWRSTVTAASPDGNITADCPPAPCPPRRVTSSFSSSDQV